MSVVDNRKQKCYSICGENHRCFILLAINFCFFKIGCLLFINWTLMGPLLYIVNFLGYYFTDFNN